jgi:hypothetical protein
MPLFKAIQPDLSPRVLISKTFPLGNVRQTGKSGLLSSNNSRLINIRNDKDGDGPFGPMAKEINHAL